MWGQGTLVAKVRDGKDRVGREVLRLFRLRRAVHPTALTPHPRDVPRREGRGARPRPSNPNPSHPGKGPRSSPAPATTRCASPHRVGVADRGRAADRWLLDTVRWAWRTRILVHLGIDTRMKLWQVAEDEAVRVFAANLRDLLLAAPAGARPTMGLDPGFRTGVKVAVVDATGKVVATDTIYPARAPAQVGRVARGARPARAGAPGRTHRDRQRHRLARDRQTRRRI